VRNKFESSLLFGSILWFFGEGMLGPLFAVFAGRLGGDVLDIAWAWALFLIISGSLQILVGRLSDRWGKPERLMMLGFLINTLFTFAYILVRTPAHLFIVTAGLGLASALATPTWNALYDKHSFALIRGTEWGLADGAGEIVTGVGLLIGGLIISHYSFTLLFLVMGSVQTIATLYQARILWMTKKET